MISCNIIKYSKGRTSTKGTRLYVNNYLNKSNMNYNLI